MKKVTYITMGLVVMLLLGASSMVYADAQGWINNSLSFKINEKFSLKFTNEGRYHQLTYTDSFLKNWQGGIVYNFSKKFYFAALYKREDTKKAQFLLHENRLTLETGWKTKLGKKVDFDVRFRTEIRGFEDELDDNHLRFRLRARMKTKMSIGKLQLKPFIAIEPFGDTKNDEVNRYRFYAGFVFPMGKHAALVINYIQQGTKDKESIYILNTGVELKF